MSKLLHAVMMPSCGLIVKFIANSLLSIAMDGKQPETCYNFYGKEIAMLKKALLIIDMLNSFVLPGAPLEALTRGR